MFNFLRNLFTFKSNKKNKKHFFIDTSNLSNSSLPYYKEYTTLSDLSYAYGEVATLFSCINAIASSLTIINFASVKLDKGNISIYEREFIQHPILKLLENPNPFQTKEEFIEQVFTFYELFGNVFIFYDKKGGETPKALYPLHPLNVKIIQHPKKKIEGYIYTVVDENGNTQQIAFDVNEVFQLKYPSVLDDYMGIPPALTIVKDLNTHINSKIYVNNFFKNNATPSGILMTDGYLDDESYHRLKTRWKQLYAGVSNAHKVAILEGGLKFQKLGSLLSELDLDKISQISKEDIMIAFRVPPSLLGISNNINYATMREQRKIFWEDVLLPKARKFCSAINKYLMPLYRTTSIKVIVDIEEIPALRENRLDKSKVCSMLVDRGILNRNEARKIYFNLPPFEGGDEYTIPLNVYPVESGRNPSNVDSESNENKPNQRTGE